MTRRSITRAVAVALLAGALLTAIPAIYAQTGGGVDLSWHVLGGGGASSNTGGAIMLGGTLGQTAPGPSSGGAVELKGGFWGLDDGGALAVTLADFYAEQAGGLVRVTWETASELDNRGFNLYRGGSASGPDTQLNDLLIPSQSPGSAGGFVYTWDDDYELVSGSEYFYWLDDIDVYGNVTRHGPVSVLFITPTSVRLTEMRAGSLAGSNVLLTALLALLLLAGVVGQHRRRGQS